MKGDSLGLGFRAVGRLPEILEVIGNYGARLMTDEAHSAFIEK